MFRMAFLLLAALATTTAAAPAGGEPDPEVVAWVKANAVALRTVEAGNSFEDLRPVGEMVGDARIVSLGEATHGSREIFRMKHRLLEFLVREKGFTAFAIEASFSDCLAINDYVLHGKGDPEQALSGQGFWTCDTEEVLDLIRWMRRHNEDPKNARKLRFYGFDVQRPASAAEKAHAYLEQAVPGITAPLKEALAVLRSKPDRGLLAAEPEERTAVRNGLAALLKAFDENRERLVPATSAEEFELARQCAAVAAQGVELWSPRAERWSALGRAEEAALFDRVRAAGKGLEAYLAGVDPKLAGGVRELLRRVAEPPDFLARHRDRASDRQRRDWGDLSRRLLQAVEGDECRLGEREKVKGHAKDLALLLEVARRYGRRPGPADNCRDFFMAENVAWALGREGEVGKVVVWAHNWHVSFLEPAGRGGAPRLGTYLGRRFGEGHVAFGFVFNEGEFQAIRGATQDPAAGRGLQSFTVGAAKAGSIDAALAQAGLPLFALDLRRAPREGPVADWFRKDHPLRMAGAVFRPEEGDEHYEPVGLARHYDALVFIEKTTRARPTAAVKKRFGLTD
jgi:erythromycin esterase-like protein